MTEIEHRSPQAVTDLAGLIERLDELQRGQDAIRGALQQAESERERAREERDRFKALYLEMLERNRKLERGLMGQQLARDVQSQLTLDVLSAMLGERAAADIDALQGPDEPEEKKPRKKGHGRRPLPEDLPRWTSRSSPTRFSAPGSTRSSASAKR
ncbi:MAG: hypothetical protein IPL19_00240 [Sandaracinaceae bacterium]|nr:hypothetical protein [Sandaracinaceae bacterium]